MNQALSTALPANDVRDVISLEMPVTLASVPSAARRSLPGRVLDGIASVSEWVFGAAAIIVGLALLAALPLLQFLSLGYLLEAGARVARSGRLRDGFVGIRHAARLGSIVLGIWLVLLPLRVTASFTRAAQLIEP